MSTQYTDHDLAGWLPVAPAPVADPRYCEDPDGIDAPWCAECAKPWPSSGVCPCEEPERVSRGCWYCGSEAVGHSDRLCLGVER